MWCKVIDTQANPNRIYTFPEEQIHNGIYYTMSGLTSTSVEISRILGYDNELEQCAVDCFNKQIQVQLYVGEDLVKAADVVIERYMIFEVENQAVERLTLRVITLL